MWREKFKALVGHLLFSVFVLGLPLSLATWYFYPGPLFFGDGGLEVIKIALAIDIVLGPLLTFCVYKKGKKGLMLDLILIFALQIATLSYGAWTMYTQRPVAYVFGTQFFHTLTQSQIEGKTSDKVMSRIGMHPLPYFYVTLPKGLKEREAMAHEAMQAGRPFHVLAHLWNNVDEAGVKNLLPWMMKESEVQKIKTQEGRAVALKLFSSIPKDQREHYRVVIMQMRYGNAVGLFSEKARRIEAVQQVNVGSLAEY